MLKVIAIMAGFATPPAIPDHPAPGAPPRAAPPVPVLSVSGLPESFADTLVRHFLCSELSRTGRPAPDVARSCSQNFLTIKLGFVPGVTPEKYRRLPAREKARINRLGYAAWREWLAANAAQVAELRRVARNLMSGAGI